MAAPPPPPGFPVAGAAFLPPVPAPWTEHKAPGGQPYWFNPITNVSTYTRPGPPPPPAGFPLAGLPPPPPGFPIAGAPPPPAGFPVAPSPATAASSAPPAQLPPLHFTAQGELKPGKEKKEKKEKPKEKLPIEGTVWIRVTTNKGNVFFSNKETKESVWTVPEEIKAQVEEIEAKEKAEQEEKERLEREEREKEGKEREEQAAAAAANARKRKAEEDAAAAEEADQVKGDLDLEIEGQNGDVSAVPDRPTEADEQPKKKKQKKRVVTSLEELEQGDLEAEEPKKHENGEADGEEESEEDWQRRMAEQMAAEAAQEEAASAPKEATPVAEQPRGPVPVVDQVEAAALYKVLLSEKDINPMAPFETELPKFVADPRYHALKNNRDRRDIFDEFCKQKIREQRAAKKKAAEAGIKIDPLTAFRALLTTSVTSTRTHFSDFKRSHQKDPRYREFGKTEGDKEKEFKKFLRELGETKKRAAEKAEREFGEMLREDKGVMPGDKWAEVKKRHVSDPRYAAVVSSSLRESLFNKHTSALAAGGGRASSASSSSAPAAPAGKPQPTKEDKAARAAASLREREEKVRLEKIRQGREAERARGNLGKEEAEREFGQLLVDSVRDHKARFDDLAPSLSRDPRFDAPSLHLSEKCRLFDAHLQKLYRARLSDVESLFAQHSPSLLTPFHDVLPPISSSPHVSRLIGTDYDELERLYTSWLSRRTKQAREDFTQMLKENAMVQTWGRLKKMEKREKVALIGQEGTRNDESDEEADEVGLAGMAEQVDLKAIHSVLRQDKRYLKFDHIPEEREQWIEGYVDNLAAPKMTMHQRD
ncbi:hypothetical protein JCM8547_009005 [Rhodosporidiobolus lusitaniae]